MEAKYSLASEELLHASITIYSLLSLLGPSQQPGFGDNSLSKKLQELEQQIKMTLYQLKVTTQERNVLKTSTSPEDLCVLQNAYNTLLSNYQVLRVKLDRKAVKYKTLKSRYPALSQLNQQILSYSLIDAPSHNITHNIQCALTSLYSLKVECSTLTSANAAFHSKLLATEQELHSLQSKYELNVPAPYSSEENSPVAIPCEILKKVRVEDSNWILVKYRDGESVWRRPEDCSLSEPQSFPETELEGLVPLFGEFYKGNIPSSILFMKDKLFTPSSSAAVQTEEEETFSEPELARNTPRRRTLLDRLFK